MPARRHCLEKRHSDTAWGTYTNFLHKQATFFYKLHFDTLAVQAEHYDLYFWIANLPAN